MDMATAQQRFRTRWGFAGLVLAWGGLGLSYFDPDGTAKLTSYLFLLLSVFGGLLAFVCGLAHPGRRLKLLLVLLSLTYFAFAYMVKVAPSVR